MHALACVIACNRVVCIARRGFVCKSSNCTRVERENGRFSSVIARVAAVIACGLFTASRRVLFALRWRHSSAHLRRRFSRCHRAAVNRSRRPRHSQLVCCLARCGSREITRCGARDSDCSARPLSDCFEVRERVASWGCDLRRARLRCRRVQSRFGEIGIVH